MLLEDGRNTAAYGAFEDAVIAELAKGDPDIFGADLAIARIAFEIKSTTSRSITTIASLTSRTAVRARWSMLVLPVEGGLDRAVVLHDAQPYYETSFWPGLWVLEAFIYLRVQLELARRPCTTTTATSAP